MSEAVSALPNVIYDRLIKIEEQGLCGMITLRGAFDTPVLQEAVQSVIGCAVPQQRRVESKGYALVAWMSPDELMIKLPHGAVAPTIDALQAKVSGAHLLLADVSDARVVFELSGPHVREVLAKLSPVDLSKEAFTFLLVAGQRAIKSSQRALWTIKKPYAFFHLTKH